MSLIRFVLQALNMSIKNASFWSYVPSSQSDIWLQIYEQFIEFATQNEICLIF